ncbi:unnamed protein product [Nippostrongylus brasiliensis]|uniref:Oxidoreductase n=1 Tax=Nippostrongylus brasiliensis TaxID=27835 RepID=A0A0N4XTN8_NIPBR|nr:unnamed protein product [Nippostrongylus brasiliensis]
MFGQITIILCVIIVASSFPSLQKYISKYKPKVQVEGTRTIHIYPKNRIEAVLTFGASDEMLLVAEAAINDYYSGQLFMQGDETEKMGEVMENYFGKYWSVAIFDDPFGYSWTVIRR